MDNNIFELDMILSNKRYSFIYSIANIVMIIILLSLYVLFTYNYRTYYKSIGIINDKNMLEVYIYDKDIDYVLNKNMIEIDNKKYKYQVSEIDKNIYVDNNYQNYKKIYLKIDNLEVKENQALEFIIEKKNKKIIYHILDYLERR